MRLLLISLCFVACHHPARPVSITRPRAETYVFQTLDTDMPGCVHCPATEPSKRTRYALSFVMDRATLVTTEELATQDHWTTNRTLTYEGTRRVVGDEVLIELETPRRSIYACTTKPLEAAAPGAKRIRAPDAQVFDPATDCYLGQTWQPSDVTSVQTLSCTLREGVAGQGMVWGENQGWFAFAATPGLEFVRSHDQCHSGSFDYRRL